MTIAPQSSACLRRCGLLLLFFAVQLCFAEPGAQPAVVKRVLFISDYGYLSSPAIAAMDQRVLTELRKTPFQLEIYNEELELTLFPSAKAQEDFHQWYKAKYADHKPDVILAVGPEALRFLAKSHNDIWPGVPVVFCGSLPEILRDTPLDDSIAGAWGQVRPLETLSAALKLRPHTRRVVVVGGVGSYDRQVEAIARNAFQHSDAHLQFDYWTELDMVTLLAKLKQLPNDTIVYYTSIMTDTAGRKFVSSAQSVPMVAAAASVPVFVMSDVSVGSGAVGGQVRSFDQEGVDAGKIAARILNGEKASDIGRRTSAGLFLFDARALRKWGFNERDLPSGSVILNRTATPWDLYRDYVIAGLTLILLQTLLIAGLLWHRKRRRDAERKLSIAYESLQLALEAGTCVAWELDLNSGATTWLGDFESVFGPPSAPALAEPVQLRDRIHPDDRAIFDQMVSSARAHKQSLRADLRIVQPNGAIHWIAARGSLHVEPSGAANRIFGVAADVTDRKLVESERATLTARIIHAEDDERRRIARELHDDYSQRLALLAMQLQTLETEIPGLASDAVAKLEYLHNDATKLGFDLHALSRRLHPSTLDSLGLGVVVRAFCRDLSKQSGLEIRFTHDALPHLSPDVSLCLFRVIQESLRNVRRHSGTDFAEVALHLEDGLLHLTVRDDGRGFDPSRATPGSGIGLQSIGERLLSLNGRLEIHSRPAEGTCIEAWLPIEAESWSMPQAAAGD